MSALTDILARRISAQGPISLADYMAECLLHPDYGYYTNATPFGKAGDFITAPEISQMFGELCGLWLAQCWMDQGCPAPFTLAEIGPGRGTLMADALRATRNIAGFHQAARICLIEASPRLKGIQRATLADYQVTWLADISALPEAPLFLIANEFFDALPIRQFQRVGEGWCERMVGLQGGRLTLGLGPATTFAALAHRLADTRDKDIVEFCPALPAIAGAIGQRVARHAGAALIIDYGNWRSLGDTFQALRAHQAVDPFAAPGRADLTAHVDFEALAQAFTAAGATATGMTAQGTFLERLGIGARARALAQVMNDDARQVHFAAYRRLTLPQEMGQLFNAIACHPIGCATPPGLDPAV